ncbi:complex I 24 kDa subunit family protein [Defluviitalea raffinosedens]|uniref:NADH-quinone oxidoreductase subunit NuoE family protein n=1 Tax=Defluviitalea raffinosedens TaxID=1450156 RepID=UPI001756EF55|nr:NAD(P)H-dependent oxidoreductase subunit E [Defluviitalea raffinosedens]MBM7685298.1 NADH-quinone oxidoreductase subunit E/NADP-reducing hydrogenase subunit HndA [Defluviitalea raffinosedens]HHW67263.1 NAD(P)H-dependent oxidoreductase subunit E [Candidatus Epulonipiscium sp.]
MANCANCTNELSERGFRELEQFIDELSDKNGALISALHRAQEIFGYLPKEVQQFVAKKLNIPVSKVYGIVSFYSFFTMIPKGKYPISVCMGTACYVRGADKVLDEFKRELNIEVGETTADGNFSLDALRCVGACGLAPVVLVGEKVYGRVTPDQVKSILKEYE